MLFTDKVINKIRQIVYEILTRWPEQIAQSGGLPPAALPQPSEEWPGYADAFHDHPQFYDARKIWARNIAATAPADGDMLRWSASANQWVLVAGGGVGGPTPPPDPFVYLV